ncbi:unnamed protein product [Closterium sp. NIES-65]|nr:unnamed protein product [Closterium sp. NIES-65]
MVDLPDRGQSSPAMDEQNTFVDDEWASLLLDSSAVPLADIDISAFANLSSDMLEPFRDETTIPQDEAGAAVDVELGNRPFSEPFPFNTTDALFCDEGGDIRTAGGSMLVDTPPSGRSSPEPLASVNDHGLPYLVQGGSHGADGSSDGDCACGDCRSGDCESGGCKEGSSQVGSPWHQSSAMSAVPFAAAAAAPPCAATPPSATGVVSSMGGLFAGMLPSSQNLGTLDAATSTVANGVFSPGNASYGNVLKECESGGAEARGSVAGGGSGAAVAAEDAGSEPSEGDAGEGEGEGRDAETEKREARLIRNRESAQLSRQRKKYYMDELEAQIRTMSAAVAELNSAVAHLTAENVSLRRQLAFFYSSPSAASAASAAAAAAAAGTGAAAGSAGALGSGIAASGPARGSGRRRRGGSAAAAVAPPSALSPGLVPPILGGLAGIGSMGGIGLPLGALGLRGLFPPAPPVPIPKLKNVSRPESARKKKGAPGGSGAKASGGEKDRGAKKQKMEGDAHVGATKAADTAEAAATPAASTGVAATAAATGPVRPSSPPRAVSAAKAPALALAMFGFFLILCPFLPPSGELTRGVAPAYPGWQSSVTSWQGSGTGRWEQVAGAWREGWRWWGGGAPRGAGRGGVPRGEEWGGGLGGGGSLRPGGRVLLGLGEEEEGGEGGRHAVGGDGMGVWWRDRGNGSMSGSLPQQQHGQHSSSLHSSSLGASASALNPVWRHRVVSGARVEQHAVDRQQQRFPAFAAVSRGQVPNLTAGRAAADRVTADSPRDGRDAAERARAAGKALVPWRQWSPASTLRSQSAGSARGPLFQSHTCTELFRFDSHPTQAAQEGEAQDGAGEATTHSAGSSSKRNSSGGCAGSGSANSSATDRSRSSGGHIPGSSHLNSATASARTTTSSGSSSRVTEETKPFLPVPVPVPVLSRRMFLRRRYLNELPASKQAIPLPDSNQAIPLLPPTHDSDGVVNTGGRHSGASSTTSDDVGSSLEHNATTEGSPIRSVPVAVPGQQQQSGFGRQSAFAQPEPVVVSILSDFDASSVGSFFQSGTRGFAAGFAGPDGGVGSERVNSERMGKGAEEEVSGGMGGSVVVMVTSGGKSVAYACALGGSKGKSKVGGLVHA